MEIRPGLGNGAGIEIAANKTVAPDLREPVAFKHERRDYTLILGGGGARLQRQTGGRVIAEMAV
eukprot:4643152-Pyramimonas_sp.AAC.1